MSPAGMVLPWWLVPADGRATYILACSTCSEYLVSSSRDDRHSLPMLSHLLTLPNSPPTDSIFYDDKTHILFATFKYIGYDYAGDMEIMRENPKVREWWKMTDAFQESLVEGATSSESGEPSWWKPLEEVFYQA